MSGEDLSNNTLPTEKQFLRWKRLYNDGEFGYDWSWWLKWISSGIVIVAMCLRGAQVLPFFDLCLSAIGSAGWLGVGIMWKDRALIILNSAACTILITGILKIVFGDFAWQP